MPEDAERRWFEIVPPKYVAGVLLAVLGGIGTFKGVENSQRIEAQEGDYVSVAVFHATVDTLKARIRASDVSCKAAMREARRARAGTPLTKAEQAQVDALVGPPEPERRGTLLRSLFGWLKG